MAAVSCPSVTSLLYHVYQIQRSKTGICIMNGETVLFWLSWPWTRTVWLYHVSVIIPSGGVTSDNEMINVKHIKSVKAQRGGGHNSTLPSEGTTVHSPVKAQQYTPQWRHSSTLPTLFIVRIFIPFLMRMHYSYDHYGHDLFRQIYTISAVNESKQEVSCFINRYKVSDKAYISWIISPCNPMDAKIKRVILTHFMDAKIKRVILTHVMDAKIKRVILTHFTRMSKFTIKFQYLYLLKDHLMDH